MVVPSPSPMHIRKTKAVGIPTIDLSTRNRSKQAEQIIEACEEYGFFKVVNHGVPKEVIARIEEQGFDFFGKPAEEKQRAGPASPLGYGVKNIGKHGDMGEVEYLLLQSDPLFISQTSNAVSSDPTMFSFAVNEYIEAVRGLACEVLDLVGEGLWISDMTLLSSFIRDVQSDSILRLNHYPALDKDVATKPAANNSTRIGFGEHSDPQILTILRSNDVAGLQICLDDGLWVPVPPDSNEFFVMVGDALQALTNGRFESVRHRVMSNSVTKARMSMVYFGAPSLNTWISPLPEMVTPQKPSLYKSFTWGQYKKAAYTTRLGDSRLDNFRSTNNPSTCLDI